MRNHARIAKLEQHQHQAARMTWRQFVTGEVKPDPGEWRAFLDRIEHQHPGTLAQLEQLPQPGARKE